MCVRNLVVGVDVDFGERFELLLVPGFHAEVHNFEVAHVRDIRRRVQAEVLAIDEYALIEIAQQFAIIERGAIERSGESAIFFHRFVVLFNCLERIVAGQEQRTRFAGHRIDCQIISRPFRRGKCLDEGCFGFLMGHPGFARLQEFAGDDQDFRRLVQAISFFLR